MIDKGIDASMEIVETGHKTVCGPCFKPFLQKVGRLYARTDNRRIGIEHTVSEYVVR